MNSFDQLDSHLGGQLLAGRNKPRRASIPRRDPQIPAPLSFGQQRFSLVEQLLPDAKVANYAYAIRINGDLKISALERAIAELTRRHEVLRTVFIPRNGELVQNVLAVSVATVNVRDMTAAEDPAAAAYHRAGLLCDEPYLLDEQPPIRWELMRLGDLDHLLLVCVHHVAIDGWSESVLYRELSDLYTSYAADAEASVPPLPVQYADYATWQRERAASGAFDRDVAYWRDQLAGAPRALRLPFDRPVGPLTGYAGDTLTQEIPAGLAGGLERLARNENTTLFVALLGAFCLVLAQECDQDDLVFGVPVAGRDQPELEGLVGYFVNTVALRVDLSARPTFRQLLAQLRETTLTGLEHQQAPFEKVIEELRPAREPGRQPLVQVLFQLHNVPSASLRLPGLDVRVEQLFRGGALLDLTLSFVGGQRGLRGYWNYRTELFDRPTVERMQRALVAVAREAVYG